MESIKSLSNATETSVQKLLGNPYIMAVLKLSLALYGAQLAPRLPSKVSALLQNTVVKVIALFLISYISERDFQLAIILAVVFVLGINFLAGRPPLESFSPYSKDYKSATSATLIEPKTVIYPGCESIKLADLEKLFEGDNIKMQNTVMQTYRELLQKTQGKTAKDSLMKISYAVGLPYNIEFTDESAPYIATLLMYHGFNISEKCTAPQ